MNSSFQTKSTPSQPYKPSVLAWIPYWDQQKAFESFQKNVEVFDFISLFWYRIDQKGNIRTYDSTVEDQNIIEYAHQKNVKVLAVIANLPDYTEGGDWDWRRVDRVISSPNTRRKHIEDILKLLDEKKFDGINIDYEALRLQQRDDFSTFVEELSEALHQKDKLVGIAIHPKTSENNSEEANGSQAQDLARLSAAADQLYFMTYEEHYELSDPGPTGSLSWMKQVLGYAINDLGVDREKVFVGIPLYGYDWNVNQPSIKAGGLEFNDVTKLLEQTESEVEWNPQEGESQFTYFNRGSEHEVWFNDEKSVAAKLKLAKTLRVRSIGFWRLGGEDPDVWKTVRTLRSEN